MSDFTAVDDRVKQGTGRTAAEHDERWRLSKSAAFSTKRSGKPEHAKPHAYVLSG